MDCFKRCLKLYNLFFAFFFLKGENFIYKKKKKNTFFYTYSFFKWFNRRSRLIHGILPFFFSFV